MLDFAAAPRRSRTTAPPTRPHRLERKKEEAPKADDEQYCTGDAGTLVRALKQSATRSPYATPRAAGDIWDRSFASSPLVDVPASLFFSAVPGTIALCRDGTAVTYNLLEGRWDPRGARELGLLGVARLRKVVYDAGQRAWLCYRGVHDLGWLLVPALAPAAEPGLGA